MGKCRGLDNHTLKMIACLSMFIDHISAVVLLPLYRQGILTGDFVRNYYNVSRDTVGRIAFPIFCFLLVEGFYRTASRKNYALRLLIFALLAEIPYDLAFCGSMFDWGKSNVLFTLLLGLLMLTAIEKCRSGLEKKGYPVWVGYPVSLLIAAAAGALAWLIKSSYDYKGIIAIYLLYCFYFYKKEQLLVCGVAFCWEIGALLALVPLFFYNRQKGKKYPRYLFYAFYPFHLLFLTGIRWILLKHF